MRKKFLLFMVLLAIFLAGTAGQVFAVDIPDPKGYVTDSANILSPSQEQALEKKISQYEKDTSVEIAVVTIKSLEGLSIEDYSIQLAEQWKVGKAGNDNGLIFLIALDDRKMRIEVGYGLEGDMPDISAADIIDRVKPYFREEDYAGGINYGVGQIIQTLGSKTSEQRAEEAKQRREAEAQAQAEFEKNATYFGLFLAVILLLAGIVFLFYRIVVRPIMDYLGERAKRQAKQEKISKSWDSLSASSKELTLRFDSLKSKIAKKADLPDSYSKELSGLIEAIQKSLNLANNKLQRDAKISSNKDDVMQGAQKVLNAVHDDLNQVIDSMDQADAILQELEAYQKDVPKKVKEAEKKLLGLENLLANLKKQGYRFYFETAGARRKLSRADNLLKVEKSDPKIICEFAEAVLSEVSRMTAEVNNLTDSERYVQVSIPWLKKEIDSLKSGKLDQADVVYSKIKEANPQSALDGLTTIKSASSMVSSAKCFLDEAEDLNSKEKQQFSIARQKADEAQRLVKTVNGEIAKIYEREKEIISAEKKTPGLLSDLNGFLEKAERACSDSDVGSQAKGRLNEARDKLREAQRVSSSSPANWLLLMALLVAGIELAQNAMRQAEDDVNKAERERERARRRKREEEEEEEERRHRSSSYYGGGYSGWSSGSSSSNDSGGGFGGFGGGDFGGGGASGGW